MSTDWCITRQAKWQHCKQRKHYEIKGFSSRNKFNFNRKKCIIKENTHRNNRTNQVSSNKTKRQTRSDILRPHQFRLVVVTQLQLIIHLLNPPKPKTSRPNCSKIHRCTKPSNNNNRLEMLLKKLLFRKKLTNYATILITILVWADSKSWRRSVKSTSLTRSWLICELKC